MLSSYGTSVRHALVAQWIEHRLAVAGVGGSSPPKRTSTTTSLNAVGFLYGRDFIGTLISHASIRVMKWVWRLSCCDFVSDGKSVGA